MTQTRMDSSVHDPRQDAIQEWCERSLNLPLANLGLASADASFRRYFRVKTQAGANFIVMDAPPANEDSRPFVQVAALLADAGIRVPRIYALDLNRGFMLLSDFGSEVLLNRLKTSPEQAGQWYGQAISELIAMQKSTSTLELATYDHEQVQRELNLFPQWFCGRHLGRAFDVRQSRQWDACVAFIVSRWASMPRAFTHRDFHSRNLMCLSDGALGLIDFQDANKGPLAYDIVSLLKDCYIRLPDSARADHLYDYWQAASDAGLLLQSYEEFEIDFELCGIQRHLKVLGIFARLYHRDGKSQYLTDLPLVRDYLLEALMSQPELEFLGEWLGSVSLSEST